MCLLAVLSQKSFALACLKDETIASDIVTLTTTIAVPNTVPKDTVLWRSPDYSIQVTCWQDQNSVGADSVYFYMNPLDPTLSQLGPDLELGIGLNGTDYQCSRLGSGSSSGNCRIQLPSTLFYLPQCRFAQGCWSDRQTRMLNFNLFVSKRSPPSTGKEGPLSGVASYVAFQLDGVDGLNGRPSRNFRMYVNGLNQLRYVACSAGLTVSPQTVNFGYIASFNASAGKDIAEKPFSLIVSKTCNSVYGLGGMLTPINATVRDGALVPNDNASVGITLLRKEDRSVLPFNEEFVLVAPTGDQVVIKDFLARLKWMSRQPIVGPFNAAAAVDIYYK